jgi:hypothetical protein
LPISVDGERGSRKQVVCGGFDGRRDAQAAADELNNR